MSVGAKVGVVVGFCTIMFIIFGVYSYATLNAVKINAPNYKSIVQGKDLIADVLPPPAYIIESYLLVHLIMDYADQGAERGVIRVVHDPKGEVTA